MKSSDVQNKDFNRYYSIVTLIIALISTFIFYYLEMKHFDSIAMVAWCFTVFALLFEVIFVFQPMSYRIKELEHEMKFTKETLEQEVQLRTISLEQANQKLLKLASHDPLTGLKNRLNLEHHLEVLLEHYAKHGIPFAVLIIDIDWFKKINDTYGHDAGDFVLRELSILIQNSIRPEDSAYRAGGEEFVIVFNRILEDKALEKAESIRQMVENYLFSYNDIDLNVTISGGVYHPHWITMNEVQGILKLADEALYRVKRSGRNKILATEKMEMSMVGKIALSDSSV